MFSCYYSAEYLNLFKFLFTVFTTAIPNTNFHSSPIKHKSICTYHFNHSELLFQAKDDNLHVNGTSRPASALRGETPIPTETSTHFTPLVQVLHEQLRLMKKAEARKESKQRYEAQCNEWRIVAIILDRLFLILFTITSVITSLALLIPLTEHD